MSFAIPLLRFLIELPASLMRDDLEPAQSLPYASIDQTVALPIAGA
jgi:hypothetical protein